MALLGDFSGPPLSIVEAVQKFAGKRITFSDDRIFSRKVEGADIRRQPQRSLKVSRSYKVSQPVCSGWCCNKLSDLGRIHLSITLIHIVTVQTSLW